MSRLAFGGQDFRVAGRTALFWPARRALIVADLHLEKASWFAERGQMLPPYDTLATLRSLAAQIVATGSREVWCLGDNFHDREGPSRLPHGAREILKTMTDGLAWHWITGNHDADLPKGIGGTILAEAECNGLIMRHRAETGETQPELSGHFHPKHRIVARGRSVSRACFVRTPTKLILPAFGALTGGLAAEHPEIRAAAGARAQALVPVAGRVLEFALP